MSLVPELGILRQVCKFEASPHLKETKTKLKTMELRNIIIHNNSSVIPSVDKSPLKLLADSTKVPGSKLTIFRAL